VEPRAKNSDLVNVIIDTPRGSGNKYKFDEELRMFKISRLLPVGMHFPYDFGSIPGTRAEDGDPLDVLVLLDAPTFPGCLVSAKLIGGFGAKQREGTRMVTNDRLIAVPETAVNRAAIRSIRSLPESQLREIERFFIAYNEAQDRELRVTSRFTTRAAEGRLAKAMRAFERHKKSAK
jgi:inorganic pyrophosphatase